MTSRETTSMAALEQLLSDLHDRTQSEPAIAESLREALMLCRTAFTVGAGLNIQLQGALASIRIGRSDDAAKFIEGAIDMQTRWSGAQ